MTTPPTDDKQLEPTNAHGKPLFPETLTMVACDQCDEATPWPLNCGHDYVEIHTREYTRVSPASTTSDRIWLDKYGHRLYDDHPLKLQGIEYIRAEGFIAAFKDASIKVHIGFKHEGPWEECEWVQCEDRRKMIEGAPASTAPTVDDDYSTDKAVGQKWLLHKDAAERVVARIADNDCLTCKHWSADAVYAISVELAAAATAAPVESEEK